MSQITILNESSELVRIALYKRSVFQPALDTIAWQIVDPPPGGQVVIAIAENYQAFADYSLDVSNPDPTRPGATVYQTDKVPFNETTARFVINSVPSQDRMASGAVINPVHTGLVSNQVRMENKFGMGVVSHIQKDGQDVYPPQVLWPGGMRIEDVRAPLFLAVVSQFVCAGNRLVDEEIQMTETPIPEGGTATVSGSKWTGYSIVVA